MGKSSIRAANNSKTKNSQVKPGQVKTPLWRRRMPLYSMHLKSRATDTKPLFILHQYVDRAPWAYPCPSVLTCFRKALMLLPDKTLGMLNFLKHSTEKWNLERETKKRRAKRVVSSIEELSWQSWTPSPQNLYSLIHDLLSSQGSARSKKCRQLKTLVTNAIDLLTTDGMKARDPREKMISIPRNEFPFSLMLFDRLSRYRYEQTLGWSNGALTHQEEKRLQNKHQRDCSIIKMPIPCIAIEYARRFAQMHSKLPSKKELREIIERNHPKETEDLSAGFWSKIWASAGLQSLSRKADW